MRYITEISDALKKRVAIGRKYELSSKDRKEQEKRIDKFISMMSALTKKTGVYYDYDYRHDEFEYIALDTDDAVDENSPQAEEFANVMSRISSRTGISLSASQNNRGATMTLEDDKRDRPIYLHVVWSGSRYQLEEYDSY